MPAAYKQIRAKRDTPLFVFGDHASRFIPDTYDNLGLSGDDLTRHIAWDIGTDKVIQTICAHFGCGGQVAGVSRLVIDLNRDVSMDSLIPVTSDGTKIPGNQKLSNSERQARIDDYHTPYHTALTKAVDKIVDPLVVSVHSFTPETQLGDIRLVDIGLLVKHDIESAKAYRDMFMRLGHNFTIGMNEPYSAYDLNYTIDHLAGETGLRHLAVEINQRHIDTNKKAEHIGRILADRLEPLVYRTFDPID